MPQQPTQSPTPAAREHKALRAPLALILSLCVAACSLSEPSASSPTDAEPAPPESESDGSAAGAPNRGELIEPGGALPAPSLPTATEAAIGFAMSKRRSLVAFDARTGETRAEFPLSNTVHELAWLSDSCQLVARVSADGRSQRLFAFRLSQQAPAGELELSLESASEELWGDVRILSMPSFLEETLGAQRSPAGPGVTPPGIFGGLGSPGRALGSRRTAQALWLSHGDSGTLWQRLGAQLEPLNPGVLWPAPKTWLALPHGRVAALVGAGAQTELVIATLRGSHQELRRQPAPGGVGLVQDPEGLSLWYSVGPETARLALVDLSTLESSSGYEFAPHGELLALRRSEDTLVAYLQDISGAARVKVFDLKRMTSRRFPAKADRSLSPLAAQGDSMWFSTTSGVLRASLGMKVRRAFKGADLRAPLLVPSTSELRCLDDKLACQR